MNLAVLGTDDDTMALVDAALQAGHSIVWLGDVRATDSTRMEQLVPALSVQKDWKNGWEVVLDPALCDAVILGKGTQSEEARIERLKRLAADAIPTLATFPISTSVLPYYELDMMRQGVGGILRCYMPLSSPTPLVQMAEWVAKGHETIGQIQQIGWVRNLAGCSQQAVMESLASDAAAMLTLVGQVAKVSAFGPVGDDSKCDENYASLNVQLSNPLQTPIHWSVAKTDSNPHVELTLVGDQGKVVVTIPEGSTKDPAENLTTAAAWPMSIQAESKNSNSQLPNENTAHAAIEHLAEAIAIDDRNSSECSNWDQATRAMEIVDATQLSLQKGRTIEVLHQQLTEHLAFKGIMSAFGCGLLLLVMLLLVVVGLVSDSLAVPLVGPLMALWPFGLGAVLVVFLLLQVVPIVAGKTGHLPESRGK